MEPWILLALGGAAVGTAALSATFGMAGGLVLMGIYTALLPVPEAMVLHGVTQLVSNGGRAWLLRTHVQRGGIGAYLAGAGVAWLALRGVAWSPSELAVCFGLGALPFVALAAPESAALDFARRRGAALCGALVSAAQIAFGVAGPLLDLFFVRTTLLRREVVATKAVTQALSHTLKVAYFAPALLVGAGGGAGGADLDALATAAAVSVAGALVGTRLGGRLLDRLGEDTFRRWTRRLVLAIGAGFLARGLVLV